MEPPDKTLEAWLADVNRDPDTNATLDEFRLAFKMLYLWHGMQYIQDCFMTGKAWHPRIIREEDRTWLIDYLRLKEFPPVRVPEKKKRKERKSKEDED